MAASSPRKGMLAWAFYDWANSAFITTVVAGFFPIFFKEYWSQGSDAAISSAQLGFANSTAGLIVAIFAPLLGAIADNSRSRKSFLAVFVVLGSVSTAMLFTVEAGNWFAAATFFVFAMVGYLGGNIFYDALIMNVSTPATIDRVSAIGFGIGYLGGGLLFAINVLMFKFPAFFHIDSGAEAVRWSFLTVAVWWALFAMPLFLRVSDRNPDAVSIRLSIIKGMGQLWQTCKELRQHKNIILFLVSYWLYIDGVHTVITMAVDYGKAIGFSSGTLITALLVVQVISLPATLAFSTIAKRFSARTGILTGLCIYTATAIYAFFMTSELEFYALAIAVGIAQGGVQCLSRSLFGTIIPKDRRTTQFFGFYNMVGKFAAIVGPALMGVVLLLTGSNRLSIAFISVLFILGGALLCTVRIPSK